MASDRCCRLLESVLLVYIPELRYAAYNMESGIHLKNISYFQQLVQSIDPVDTSTTHSLTFTVRDALPCVSPKLIKQNSIAYPRSGS